MTTILGVHLGHDASATVLHDGKILSHILRERHSKVRHHLGIDRDTIESALNNSGKKLADIDFVSITSTQQIYNINNNPDFFNFDVCNDFTEFWQADILNSRLIESHFFKKIGKTIFGERYTSSDSNHFEFAKAIFNELMSSRKIPNGINAKWEIYSILQPLFGPASWLNGFELNDTLDHFKSQLKLNYKRQCFHYPLSVKINGKSKRGFFVNHHMAHAASSFYSSNFDKSLIMTHDGGVGVESGFYFLGNGSAIQSIGPHGLECGQFYDHVAAKIGLGTVGGAGKLMGLSSYGFGMIKNAISANTGYGLRKQAGVDLTPEGSIKSFDFLYNKMVSSLKEIGVDTDTLGDPNSIPNTAANEIAYTAQSFFSDSVKSSIEKVVGSLTESSMTDYTKNLCLSGGAALNCPSNTNLFNAKIFDAIHVEPHCEDGGLSIGSSCYVYYNLLNKVREPVKNSSDYAILGPRFEGDIEIILKKFNGKIEYQKPNSWEEVVAKELLDDKIIGIFHKGYETGPRALGNRSIISNPSNPDNWRKINIIKKREFWRPFAPIVLQESLSEFFQDGPSISPFMLFTHTVKKEKESLIPAVTHVDKTCRVQTITKDDFHLDRILRKLKEFGLPPVLLNTSFNGPGQPILQDPEDALDMLLNTELDMVVIDGYCIFKI